MFESGISAGATEKLPCSENLCISSWSYDVEGHAKKCVERFCELANKTTQQLYKVSTPCIDDHHFKEEEMKSVGELSQVCSQIVLKCLYSARIERPDILWSVNKLARAVTKGTRVCVKRLARLISHIHHTRDFKQYWHVGHTAHQCMLGLLHDSDFAGDLEDSKSTWGEFCAHLEVIRLFHKLDVQETDFCLTHFNRIWNCLSWCRSPNGWNSRLKCWILLPTNQRDPKRMYRKPATWHTMMKTNQEQKFRLPTSTTILNYATSILFLQTWSLLNPVRCFTFLKATRRWSRWS